MCVLKRKIAVPNSGVDMVQYLFHSLFLLNWFNIDSVPMGILDCNQLCKSKRKIKFQTILKNKVRQKHKKYLLLNIYKLGY